MSLLEHAVRAQRQGFWIFPIAPGEKGCKYRWSQVASNDLAKIIPWWTATPMANIGVACRQSGLFILDCDTAKRPWQLMQDKEWKWLHGEHGQIVDGTDVLHAWANHPDRGGVGEFDRLCTSYSVLTTKGGVHIYLRWESDKRAMQSSVVKGVLDVRTNGGDHGGYVLAAGSQTAHGPYSVLASGPILPAPAWVVDHFEEKPAEERTAPSDADRFMSSGGGWTGLANNVARQAEGNRNQCLYHAARTICDEGGTQDLAWDYLSEAGRFAGLTDSEIHASIASGFRGQNRKVNR